jgi:hypothetical protein
VFGIRVEGSVLRVWGSGCRLQGAGCRVQGANLETQLLDGGEVHVLGGRLCLRCRVSYAKLGFRFESRVWIRGFQLHDTPN